jgi:hypothetical protein
MSNDKKSMPKSESKKNKVSLTSAHIAPAQIPFKDSVETKTDQSKYDRILSFLPKCEFIGQKPRPAVCVQQAVVPAKDRDARDSEAERLFKEVSAGTEITVQFGAVFTAPWTSATTDIRTFLWDPSANAQFILLAGLFSQFTLDEYHVEFLSDYAEGSNLSPKTFLVCDDPSIFMTSVTETEMASMTGFQFTPLANRITSLQHTVGRKKLLLAQVSSQLLMPGGWLSTEDTWGGQTVTFARSGPGATPGTETYLRAVVRWRARFRNHFDA